MNLTYTVTSCCFIFQLFCVIVINPVPADNACGDLKPQTLLGVTSIGEITSPDYPSIYPNDADCQWHINVDFGYVVKLTFLEFDLEDG